MAQPIEDRITTIEARLATIERHLGIIRQEAEATPPEETSPPPPSAIAKPGNWLGIVAVVCFVVAAGLMIKLSAESGWFTATRQMAIAALFGLSLIGAGFALLRTDRSYASLLPGAGVIVLYFTAFSAHSYYGLMSSMASLVALVLVSAVCTWLYTHIRHMMYIITAVIGAYLSPLILSFHSVSVFTLYYSLICSAAFALVSLWVESRAAIMISAYLAIIVSVIVGNIIHQPAVVAMVLAVHFIIVTAGTYLYARLRQTWLSARLSLGFLPALLMFHAAEYYFVERSYPGLGPWLSLLFAAILMGCYWLEKRRAPAELQSQTTLFIFTTVVCFHSVYLVLLPDNLHPWLFIAIMLCLAFYPIEHKVTKMPAAFIIPACIVAVVVVIEYLRIVITLIASNTTPALMAACLACISLWTLFIVKEKDKAFSPGYRSLCLFAAHVLAIILLDQLVKNAGSLAVSMSWLGYAVLVIAWASYKKNTLIVRQALLILGLAACKLLFYDADSAPTMLRIACLLLTGAVLYGAGIVLRKMPYWERTTIKAVHPPH